MVNAGYFAGRFFWHSAERFDPDRRRALPRISEWSNAITPAYGDEQPDRPLCSGKLNFISMEKRGHCADRPSIAENTWYTHVVHAPLHSVHPPLIPRPLHRRTTCWSASIQSSQLPRGTQIPIAPAARPHVPLSAVSLYGAFFVKEFARAANLLSFVSFFVRSQSPFLRPDPRFADVVARRSCQGWPPRQACGMLRACQAIP